MCDAAATDHDDSNEGVFKISFDSLNAECVMLGLVPRPPH